MWQAQAGDTDLVSTNSLSAMERPWILITISRAIGVFTFRYVPESGLFKKDNGPMLIYWMILHLVYVLLLPCIFLVMVTSYFHCQKLDMLAIAYSVVSLTKGCSLLLFLSSSWHRRRRWLRLGNGLIAFQQVYRRDLMKAGYSYWLSHLWKVMLTLSRFLLMIHLLFGPGSLLNCPKIDKEVLELSYIYMFLALVIVPMEMIVSSVDYWIYHMISISNWVLDCIMQDVQALRQDMRWLPQRRGCYRVVYQKQLLSGWHELWKHCMHLDRLMLDLLHIYKWQILLNLFTNYVTDITVIFNLVIYSNGPFVMWRLLCYLILCTLYHWDIMSYFSMFSTYQLQWMHLLQRLHKLWFTLSSLDIDWQEDTHCIALYRQLEFAIIFLNRKLQRRPDRIRQLHIVGLFDMNRSSGFCLSTSIAINVLILWQIAYKNYY